MRALGLVAMADELRAEAGAVLASFAAAGVSVKIISGDDPDTVVALARQAGIGDVASIAGPELDGLDEPDLGKVAEAHTVFGRITPAQKERLVGALKARGHYVAMIGDGVNDVLSPQEGRPRDRDGQRQPGDAGRRRPRADGGLVRGGRARRSRRASGSSTGWRTSSSCS